MTEDGRIIFEPTESDEIGDYEYELTYQQENSHDSTAPLTYKHPKMLKFKVKGPGGINKDATDKETVFNNTMILFT